MKMVVKDGDELAQGALVPPSDGSTFEGHLSREVVGRARRGAVGERFQEADTGDATDAVDEMEQANVVAVAYGQ